MLDPAPAKLVLPDIDYSSITDVREILAISSEELDRRLAELDDARLVDHDLLHAQFTE